MAEVGQEDSGDYGSFRFISFPLVVHFYKLSGQVSHIHIPARRKKEDSGLYLLFGHSNGHQALFQDSGGCWLFCITGCRLMILTWLRAALVRFGKSLTMHTFQPGSSWLLLGLLLEPLGPSGTALGLCATLPHTSRYSCVHCYSDCCSPDRSVTKSAKRPHFFCCPRAEKEALVDWAPGSFSPQEFQTLSEA